jgi:starch phosphorylase
MNNITLEMQSDMLAQKTKHYLITSMGRTIEEASDEELFRAFSFALREEIMINWLTTEKTFLKGDVRKLYYLSMEFLPGRILTNNIINIGAFDIVAATFRKLNRSYPATMHRESDPGLGNGGLGRLASCFLDSLATLHYPARGYGLRYQYGIFEQQIWDGLQIEAPDCWLINENPWEMRRDLDKVHVKFCGTSVPTKNIHGDEIYELHDYEEVWAVPYDIPIVGYAKDQDFSVLSLRLWSTKESPQNFQLQRYNAGRLDQAAENTALTDVLYPSDNHETGKRVRLKQEFLLVSASLQDIIRTYRMNHTNFRAFADKVRIQINDTHPALIIPELMRILNKNYDIPWKMCYEITSACTGYTNHTILREALEEWDQNLMQYLLPRQYRVIEHMNQHFCNVLRERYPTDEEKVRRLSIIENGKVRMALLAVIGSHKVNGVAKLHTKILQETIFKDFHDAFPDWIVNVTNGVTQRRWLLTCNPDLARFITARIGDGWITDFTKIKELAKFADDSDSLNEFLAIKKKNKHRLIEMLCQENKPRNNQGLPIGDAPLIDPDSLFDIQIKRIHEYKRQLMNVLHTIILYQELLAHPGEHTRVKRTVIFAGKAAGAYETAKDIIRLICSVARKINHDEKVNKHLKVIYVENYNVSKAEIIIPAADVSEQISTAGTEASGTGNMKLAINGALSVATRDGANIEMEEEISPEWWPFAFGAVTEEITKLKASQKYCPKDICEANPKFKEAVDTLRNRTFAVNDEEHQAFQDLYHKLLEGHYGDPPDRYFSFLDLESFYQVQKKVEELYRQPLKWAQFAIHNIAGMGKFSSDVAVNEYAKVIWGLQQCPLDKEILEQFRYLYSELDSCRIYPREGRD